MAKKAVPPPDNSLSRFAWTFIGLGLCGFTLLSLVSFQATDWPNPDSYTAGGTENLCGRTGAWLAYYLRYYLGPAAYVFVLGFGVWVLLRAVRGKVEQLALRAIGVVIVGAVFSATSYLWKTGSADSLTIGNGGILGISLCHFLLEHTALAGTILVLSSALLVGLLLAADNILLLLPGLLLQALEGMRQAGPLLAGWGRGRAGACRSSSPG